MALNMIQSDRSIVIFSHPRSGSTWFQNSLKQYSLGELFNLNLQVRADENIHFNFVKHGYDFDKADSELKHRFFLYDHFEKLKQAVSVKIHGSILNENIISFLKSRQMQYVLLERKNKANAFWSLLIAWTLNNWHDPINKQTICVSHSVFNKVLKLIDDIDRSFEIISDNFSPIRLYYEDMLSMPDNDWFASTKKYQILDGKSIVDISNLKEVNIWLSDAGKKEWILL